MGPQEAPSQQLSPGGQHCQQQEPGPQFPASSRHTTVGQAKARRLQGAGGREMSWTLRPPTPTAPGAPGLPPGVSAHPLQRERSHLPAPGQQIRYQSPGPWSFRTAGAAAARPAVSSMRHHTPGAHTQQNGPRQAESLPELVKRTPPLKNKQNDTTLQAQVLRTTPESEAGLVRN